MIVIMNDCCFLHRNAYSLFLLSLSHNFLYEIILIAFFIFACSFPHQQFWFFWIHNWCKQVNTSCWRQVPFIIGGLQLTTPKHIKWLLEKLQLLKGCPKVFLVSDTNSIPIMRIIKFGKVFLMTQRALLKSWEAILLSKQSL